MSWFMDVFRRPDHLRIARESLHVARIELLQAQHFAEHYRNSEQMLHERISRLSAYLADNEPANVELLRPHGSAESGRR